ncbi:MAG TPA: TonB-dependent receptor [Rhizomicrobium sp.]|nr:TonB-dependent receptor [Rhizomicrobium sp.]
MKAKYKISCAVGALLSSYLGTTAAYADNTPVMTASNAPGGGIEEVVVTAERRAETVQKTPMTIQAFTGDQLSTQNVNDIQDLLKYTPSVTYGNNGPGQGEIFMRGLSNGFRGNQSTGTVGLYPNVAIYLDEQSMQFPARNVDIYMVDMQRVEVLEGPQGTLFGGGAEAGALRYITNKPDPSAFAFNAEGMGGFTSDGAPNASFNATVNVPIIDNKLAVRAVVYYDHEGGYIDNVPSLFQRNDDDPGNVVLGIHPTAGVCPDGGTNAWQQGGQGWCTLPGAPGANNAGLAKKDQNPITHEGARISALYDIDQNWNVLISESLQKLDAEGLSVEYPTGSNFQPLAPLQVTAFAPSFNKDSYSNTAWTVNGKIGDFSAIYTGGWTLRNVEQQMEYTNYSRTYYGIYYACSGGTSSYSQIDNGGPLVCHTPAASWHDSIRNTHMSHEARISTPDDWRLRGIVGAYYEQFRIYDNMNFNYKSIPTCTQAILSSQVAGEPVCLGAVEPYPGSTANDPNPRGPTTAFGEDVQRGYDQTAFFGSLDFDIIPHTLTATAGTRWFQYKEFELGSVYTTGTGCENVLTCFASFPKHDIDAHHDHVTFAGFKSRLGLTWNIDDDTMAYYLFSQGFRPGGFNRYNANAVLKDGSGNPQWITPNSFSPDSLVNQEVGVKGLFFNHNLQLNLSAYAMRWSNVQFLFFQPQFTGNVTFATNGPSYNIKGAELQFVGRPMEGLTLSGAATYNDNTEASVPCIIGNIPTSPAFGKCITSVKGNPYPNPYGEVGGIAAFSPKWQMNLHARYDWQLMDYLAYAAGGVSYTGSMFNQPANYVPGDGLRIPTTTYLRYFMPSYTTFDAQFGLSKDHWSAELFGENLGNSHASTFTSSAQWIKSEVPLRPRVIGLKVSYTY